MKEQHITIEIDAEGRITADAEGFSGDACLKDLERLLDGLAAGVTAVERKPDNEATGRTTQRAPQGLGRKR